MLPAASVNWFLRKNGSGASTASYLVPAVRLTATAYQRLTTPSRLQKIRPRIHSSFEICTLYSCPNCEELYRSDSGPDWPGCSPCSSFKHMRSWLKCQKIGFTCTSKSLTNSCSTYSVQKNPAASAVKFHIQVLDTLACSSCPHPQTTILSEIDLAAANL